MITKKQGFWSRPRGALLLGAAACAACCAPPIVALIIGAGAASTIAAIAEPLAGILLAAGALLGITLYVRRRRARTAAASCATDGGCGCAPTAIKRTLYSSPDPVPEAPIACTVDLSNREGVQAGSIVTGARSSISSARSVRRWAFDGASEVSPGSKPS